MYCIETNQLPILSKQSHKSMIQRIMIYSQNKHEEK